MNRYGSPRVSTRSRFSPTLPTELWTDIFSFATYSDVRDNFSRNLIEIEFFAHMSKTQSNKWYQEALNTKCALSLVCSSWKTLSLPFLLEDIRIKVRTAHALMAVLEQDAGLYGPFMGSVVRCARVQVYKSDRFSLANEGTHVAPCTGRILSLCPNIRLFMTLPCVLLSEGYHTGETCYPIDTAFRDLQMPRLVYAQLCGKFAVPDFVLRAPEIQYISTIQNSYEDTIEPRGKIRILDVDDAPRLTSMKLGISNLERLIIRNFPGTLHFPYLSYLAPSIPSVRCLELGSKNTAFLSTKTTTVDFLQFLSLFPGLVSVYYPITALNRCVDERTHTTDDGAHHSSAGGIRTIGLHAGMPTILEEDSEPIVRHFEWICGGSTPFSGLERIVLYGLAWRDLSKRSCFGRIVAASERIGITLDSEHELFYSSS